MLSATPTRTSLSPSTSSRQSSSMSTPRRRRAPGPPPRSTANTPRRALTTTTLNSTVSPNTPRTTPIPDSPIASPSKASAPRPPTPVLTLPDSPPTSPDSPATFSPTPRAISPLPIPRDTDYDALDLYTDGFPADDYLLHDLPPLPAEDELEAALLSRDSIAPEIEHTLTSLLARLYDAYPGLEIPDRELLRLTDALEAFAGLPEWVWYGVLHWCCSGAVGEVSFEAVDELLETYVMTMDSRKVWDMVFYYVWLGTEGSAGRTGREMRARELERRKMERILEEREEGIMEERKGLIVEEKEEQDVKEVVEAQRVLLDRIPESVEDVGTGNVVEPEIATIPEPEQPEPVENNSEKQPQELMERTPTRTKLPSPTPPIVTPPETPKNPPVLDLTLQHQEARVRALEEEARLREQAQLSPSPRHSRKSTAGNLHPSPSTSSNTGQLALTRKARQPPTIWDGPCWAWLWYGFATVVLAAAVVAGLIESGVIGFVQSLHAEGWAGSAGR